MTSDHFTSRPTVNDGTKLFFKSTKAVEDFFGLEKPYRKCHAPRTTQCGRYTSPKKRKMIPDLLTRLVETDITSRLVIRLLRELASCMLCGRGRRRCHQKDADVDAMHKILVRRLQDASRDVLDNLAVIPPATLTSALPERLGTLLPSPDGEQLELKELRARQGAWRRDSVRLAIALSLVLVLSLFAAMGLKKRLVVLRATVQLSMAVMKWLMVNQGDIVVVMLLLAAVRSALATHIRMVVKTVKISMVAPKAIHPAGECSNEGPAHSHSSTFNPYKQISAATQVRKWRRLLKQPAEGLAARPGAIYAFRRTCDPRPYIKIGAVLPKPRVPPQHLSEAVRERLKKWKKNCGCSLELLFWLPLPYGTLRAEGLMRRHLQKYRVEEINCACASRQRNSGKHNEWFAIPVAEASIYAYLYQAFMEMHPYDRDGQLIRPMSQILQAHAAAAVDGDVTAHISDLINLFLRCEIGRATNIRSPGAKSPYTLLGSYLTWLGGLVFKGVGVFFGV